MALTPADFQRALATRALARSGYFSLHRGVPTAQLSTGRHPGQVQLVDESLGTADAKAGEMAQSSSEAAQAAAVSGPLAVVPGRSTAADSQRLGLVIPKKLARRAVTRSLIKRQARQAWQQHCGRLPCGDWVVRLRTPVSRQQFPSAASDALRQLMATELAALFAAALKPQGHSGNRAAR